MAQIYVFGRVMHELTPKESQSKQPYVCFDLMERSGGEHPNFYQVWARGDQAARLTRLKVKKGSMIWLSRSFFADSSIHACLFRSLLLRFVSVPRTFLIFFLHSGQYFDIAEQGTYSTPHTVQFLGFNAVHRFVGVICNSPTKPMNL